MFVSDCIQKLHCAIFFFFFILPPLTPNLSPPTPSYVVLMKIESSILFITNCTSLSFEGKKNEKIKSSSSTPYMHFILSSISSLFYFQILSFFLPSMLSNIYHDIHVVVIVDIGGDGEEGRKKTKISIRNFIFVYFFHIFPSILSFFVFISRDFIINISWALILFFLCTISISLYLILNGWRNEKKRKAKWMWKRKKQRNENVFEIIFSADDKEANEASTCGKILIFLSWVLVFLTMPFSLLVCFKVSFFLFFFWNVIFPFLGLIYYMMSVKIRVTNCK